MKNLKTKPKPVTRSKSTASALPSWNLGDLYPSPEHPRLTRDFDEALQECQHFSRLYSGKIAALDAEGLAEAITKYEIIQDRLGRLGSYAQLLFSENMTDPKRAQFYQNAQEKLNDASRHILFFTLDINKLDELALHSKLTQPALAKYAPWLRDLRALRPYQLADDMEKMLHDKHVAGRAAWTRLFDETEAGLRFRLGKKNLTMTQVLDLFSNPKASVRKQAAKVFSATLASNIKLFSLITNTLAKDKEIEDNWRGFKRPISSRNVANLVEDDVVEALLGTVKKNYPGLSHRYYKLKAKWLKQKTLNTWDRNAPLPGDNDRSWKWNAAKDVVLNSYHAFSPELANVGRRFFDRNWIDVPPRPGKASGAFAHPTVPSSHPYLLLNFQGKTRDVMTLAHELGHGVHQVLAAKQGALMCDTPLTLAETASVFGEQLTFRELLRREKNDKRRRLLIAGKVEDMLNTVVRQTAFCEFEIRLHDRRRKGELSAEEIGQIWMEVQRESLGPAIQFDKDYAVYWAYIPHFIHTPFYVYAYAFGECLVNSLYAVYLKGSDARGKNPDFEKRYLDMLAAGGTLRHKELLKPFGLDASDPDFWQQGLNMISDFIDELEA